MTIQMFVQLPPCVDGRGHAFTIPPLSSKVVCSRCGLIRHNAECCVSAGGTGESAGES